MKKNVTDIIECLRQAESKLKNYKSLFERCKRYVKGFKKKIKKRERFGLL